MITIYPLDGGRALRLILYRFCPNRAESIMKFLAVGIYSGVLFLVIWTYFVLDLGIGTIFCGILLLIKLFPRKTPCKPFKIGVQWG